MNIKVMFSKKSDDWKTPSEIYKAFMDNGFIDPCPFQSEVDNLGKFYEHKKIFLNPPFSKMSDWWVGGNYHSKTPEEIVEVINNL